MNFATYNNTGIVTVSRLFKVMNYTSYPVFLCDGTGLAPKTLPPLITNMGVGASIPPEYAGNVVLVREDLSESSGTGQCQFQVDTCEILATPPGSERPMNERESWYEIVPNYNFVIFGSVENAASFINQYRTYYNYLLKSSFGTTFENTVNYGIQNVTGKTLYQVDDTALDDLGKSDITELPCGRDIPLPMFDQQIANNSLNLKENLPHIRAYRYGIKEEASDKYYGFMRERILYWNSETLTEDGFMYIPSFQVCIFDNYEDARVFVETYGTVAYYQKWLLTNELRGDISAEVTKVQDDMNRKNRRIVKAAGIVLSLNIATKLCEVVYNIHKDNRAERAQIRKLDEIHSRNNYASQPQVVIQSPPTIQQMPHIPDRQETVVANPDKVVQTSKSFKVTSPKVVLIGEDDENEKKTKKKKNADVAAMPFGGFHL